MKKQALGFVEGVIDHFQTKFPYVDRLDQTIREMFGLRGAEPVRDIKRLDEIHKGGTKIISPGMGSHLYHFPAVGNEPDRVIDSYAIAKDPTVVRLHNALHYRENVNWFLPEQNIYISPAIHGCGDSANKACAVSSVWGALDGHAEFRKVIKDFQRIGLSLLDEVHNPLRGARDEVVDFFLRHQGFSVHRTPNMSFDEVAEQYPDSLVRAQIAQRNDFSGENHDLGVHYFQLRGGVPVEPKRNLGWVPETNEHGRTSGKITSIDFAAVRSPGPVRDLPDEMRTSQIESTLKEENNWEDQVFHNIMSGFPPYVDLTEEGYIYRGGLWPTSVSKVI